MARVLAVADEVSESLYGTRLTEIAADLIVSCGDLPFEYLEYLVTMTGVPLLYVLGNHDPTPGRRKDATSLLTPSYLTRSHRPPQGPAGCTSVEGRWVDAAGIRVAGIGGSARYSTGPNQYTESQMDRIVSRLLRRHRVAMLRGRPGIDLLITHAPPAGVGDRDDPAHRGFKSFHRLVAEIVPEALVHGHIHHHGPRPPDLALGSTAVINVVGCRVLEVGS